MNNVVEFTPVRLAAASIGVSQDYLRKKVDAGIWSEGVHYRASSTGLGINIPEFCRWVEAGKPNRARRLKTAIDQTTDLYRHFDAQGVLLYVGISYGFLARLSQHRKKAPWYDQITSVTVEKCTSREDALARETLAIATEKPLYNVAGAVK